MFCYVYHHFKLECQHHTTLLHFHRVYEGLRIKMRDFKLKKGASLKKAFGKTQHLSRSAEKRNVKFVYKHY